MQKLVIVEAATKVKSLSQYLGKGYKVLASFGHVRDLPTKQGSVRPDEDFSLIWEVPDKAKKPLKAIEEAVVQSDTLILATDPDREGEAISWHLLEYLKSHKALRPDLKVQRVSFNAVTKETVLEALKHPRSIDSDLVDAYLARLSLDYLVGFTLSPVLWRKLPGSRSAGRVQSVALRLVVEREEDIRAFIPQDFWTIQAVFSASKGRPFSANLTHFEGKKLEKFTIKSTVEAEQWVKKLAKEAYHVHSIEKKRVQRHPQAPFITSSLQQDASRRLGFSPARTMRLAQMLYEGVDIRGETTGLITYMRTDSVQIVPEVIQNIRSYISSRWGGPYLPSKPRAYKSSQRAQEAHEAIRPTDISYDPSSLQDVLPVDAWRLYKLIWERTIACQMASAEQDQTTVVIKGGEHLFRSTGTVTVFDGFLVLYEESVEDEEASADPSKASKLPVLKEEEQLNTQKIDQTQHTTQPPARYSEAGLVKKLEELGIGRPSTYARILQVLQDRSYVRREKKRLIPEERGHIVVSFLRKFFSRYVDTTFTAMMENQLDEVSSGEKSWKKVLEDFWGPFFETIQTSQDLKIADVLSAIEPDVLPKEMQEKACPTCHQGTLHLRLGKTGPFVSCSRYPDCTYSAMLFSSENTQPQNLGKHPETGEEIFLKKGPYGWYVQCDKKRSSLSTLFSAEALTEQQALWLLSLPRPIGTYPETGDPMFLGIGRFGPYVKYGDQYAMVKKDAEGLMVLTEQEAISYVEAAIERKKKRAEKDASSARARPAAVPRARTTKSSSKAKALLNQKQASSKARAKTSLEKSSQKK
jgi:DNA topoisomerase-1